MTNLVLFFFLSEKKAKPTLSQHPHYSSLYVDEQVTFMCVVEIDSTGWEYEWFHGSESRETNQKSTNYTWKASGTHEVFFCQTKRGRYVSEKSDTINVDVLGKSAYTIMKQHH